MGGAKGTLKALENSKPDLILLDVMQAIPSRPASVAIA
jgi:hypothetical protein